MHPVNRFAILRMEIARLLLRSGFRTTQSGAKRRHLMVNGRAQSPRGEPPALRRGPGGLQWPVAPGGREASMSERFFEDPILHSPCERPSRHLEFDKEGIPTQVELEGRCESQLITPIPKPKPRPSRQTTSNTRSTSRSTPSGPWWRSGGRLPRASGRCRRRRPGC